MTVTVNIGGDSKAWQAIVTGTKLSELIVTGTVQHGPADNQSAPPGTVFQYISLVPARYDSITKAIINFTVPQSWLDENHIAPASIVLYHQTGDSWTALPTTVLSTKDGTVYFSAESTGFSLFAIAGTPSTATPAITTVATFGSVAEELPTTRPIAAKVPVTTHTTAPPATTPQPAAPSPLLNIVLVIAAIGVLAGGGFMVRRWWIRRQNPSLFKEYD
jgi:PGF-pre-PGF domain-containing protein